MRLSNGFVIDKEKTFGELKFTAVRDVFLQNEDGTPSTQLKKRIYDLKCSLHGGIIPVSVPPEVPLREFPYNAVVELVNPVADTVSRKTYMKPVFMIEEYREYANTQIRKLTSDEIQKYMSER